MRTIKVNAIDSTNSFVRKFYEGDTNFEPVCVRAISQTAGRGQRGAHWESKAGENLTFSILYPQNKLNVSRHFLLSASISLAVLEVLRQMKIPDIKVKWPNDILSAKQKLGGILIENIVKTEGIVASVIGIGINVNQKDFKNLPNAGSLRSITNQKFDLDEILELFIVAIEKELKSLPNKRSIDILEKYAENMFRLNVVSTFVSKEGERFNGIIRGVTTEGKLNLEIEDAVFKTYDLKEIQLLY
ncbi:biotin--[acetyl-CoA-carboxylase] ligase [Gramella sp. MAR_2010_147]|uniref:biotin--[acetyl-CoA-carboxylase] ligase n=1 Tax=Gramella sp. MAR_2010_147 TaxID=1250205 RepID=UPI00087A1C82|nr:biotin--[acetyl-CoA-carboxylase] ligase [Gramella sp. MAR_2010_147]SDS62067.1 BirA family transcriptional regulator, biotin operon repressor / biotin-[acetyl-CoA-carboxylase] ligase [Gramella sp. MAR_2010_147]